MELLGIKGLYFHDPVVELLCQAHQPSSSCGLRDLAAEDLSFLICHDKTKVDRLRTYLSWKETRKNAKSQEGNDMLEDGLMNDAVANETTITTNRDGKNNPEEPNGLGEKLETKSKLGVTRRFKLP